MIYRFDSIAALYVAMTDLIEFQKQRILLRGWLHGRGYFLACSALDFAESFHTGTRKDGVTPEFSHQVQIAHYVRTLAHGLIYPERTLAAALLHDVCEDYEVGFPEIEKRFGAETKTAVELLTKTYRGAQIPPETYFTRIGDDPIASIVKGIDRTHNVQSMIDVFSRAKQEAYLNEVEEYFLPMLKQARRTFHRQEEAYENIKHMLVNQTALIRAIHRAETRA